MADQATERLSIDVPPQRCYEIITDFEQYPAWARDVKEATVLECDEEGRATAVAFRVAAMGRSARYTLAYDYHAPPRRPLRVRAGERQDRRHVPPRDRADRAHPGLHQAPRRAQDHRYRPRRAQAVGRGGPAGP
ncbi:MAG: hypothetical protein E6G17_13855 [Actinobacteria bacterium]|nr:MAG: hypothetical protein E6G17_13855 [Actinomycetota bacterium]